MNSLLRAAGAALALALGFSTAQAQDRLVIAGRDQVMIKVTVVEMSRSAVKQFGINVTGNWNLLGTSTGVLNPYGPAITAAAGALTGAIGSLGSAGGAVTGNVGLGQNTNVGGTLSALERAGVSRVLAEPTLVSISGETATFHAGGEIPIVVTTACQAGSYCPPTVTYKPYGVALAFTPVVLSPGRISLRVSTEVNELDRETVVNGNIGFRTRKTATTVELPSGASMATAGLISSQSNQTISGVPGLLNLPILGTLFRSRDFQRRDSELMILVTPYLAKPMESAQVARPDAGFQDSTDPQTVLMGRLNRIYGTAGPGPAAARPVPGRFGFITD